jgi:hypothetical protein
MSPDMFALGEKATQLYAENVAEVLINGWSLPG